MLVFVVREKYVTKSMFASMGTEHGAAVLKIAPNEKMAPPNFRRHLRRVAATGDSLAIEFHFDR